MTHKQTDMKRIILFTLIFIFNYAFIQAQEDITIPYSGYAVPKERPAGYENLSAPGASGVDRVKMPIPGKSGIKLVYPVLMMHGVKGIPDQWNTFTDSLDAVYGLTFGGRFDFCLNYDGNNSTSNLNFYPTANADLALFSGTWVTGDYYYMNYEVGDDGSYPVNFGHSVLSSMSAAYKQGRAIREAVYRIMQLTGRDKVILLGHSMGGLAVRQYLQNPANWQSDGEHHIAKLVTAGSPHAGSDATLSQFGDWVVGFDDRSEGIRDLQVVYEYSGDSCVFLFGGLESYAVMDGMLFSDYYNVDVNCNSFEGNYILGLNERTMPTDLDHACIVAECDGCPAATPGDGLVLSTSANINCIYPKLTKNVFWYHKFNLIQIHGDLLEVTHLLMEGLDEPNDYALSYDIGFDITYTAFTSRQPVDGYLNDYDDFKFSIPVMSNVKVSINNIALSDLKVRFVDMGGNTIGTIGSSSGATSLIYSQVLDPGSYYLEIYEIPTNTSYLHPYNFKMTKTTVTTGIESSDAPAGISIFPNPAVDRINIEGLNGKTGIKIYDMIGNLVMQTTAEDNIELDISCLSQGVYTIIAEQNGEKIINRVVVNR